MNKTEFLEMKNEFAEYIYRYEYFLKCGAINDCYYNHFFGKNLDEVRFYDMENKLMAAVIKLKADNKSEEEINKFIEDYKTKFNQENENIANKHKLAETIVAHNEAMPAADKKQFEEDYLKYVKEHHPIVKCFINDNEENLFKVLNELYKQNNYEGFKEVLELNKGSLSNPEYKEEDFSKISAYYYDIKKNINFDFTKKTQNYPYTKNETLKSEISVARENGEIRVRINELMAANKELHKDFKDNLGFDISLR